MIDSHCHLDQEPLNENLPDIISRCKEVGIEKLLTISTTTKSFQKIVKLVEYDEIIYGTFGIHPHEADKEMLTKDEIVSKFNNKKIIGVGETGLDFYYNNSQKEKQIESFKNHIEAALYLNKPIIIHSRNAEYETYEILNEYKDSSLKILMHCFTGSYNFAKKLMNFNSFFSASGIITFKNSIDLQDTFRKLPINKLLIETDSPYLAPMPMRGKSNEPSYIKYTLKKLAELKNLKIKDLQSETTNNFIRLFES